MTMPHERLRALRWAGEVLFEICSGHTSTESDRHRAGLVLESLPTPQELLAWVRAGAALTESAAAAIEAAGTFFREQRRSSRCSLAYKDQLDRVLRHYPEPSEAELWAREASAGTLHEWLMAEDLYAKR